MLGTMEKRRRVPISALQGTGKIMSILSDGPIEYEGPLERDFITLLHFETRVIQIVSQPFTIEYKNPNGRTYSCTPDFLVRRMVRTKHEERSRFTVYEVSTTRKAALASPTFRARYEAVSKYCEQRGWLHEIATEMDIRIPRLDNAKLLLEHQKSTPPTHIFQKVIHALDTHKSMTVEELIAEVQKGEAIPSACRSYVYYMLAEGCIAWDRDKPLDANNKIGNFDLCPGYLQSVERALKSSAKAE